MTEDLFVKYYEMVETLEEDFVRFNEKELNEIKKLYYKLDKYLKLLSKSDIVPADYYRFYNKLEYIVNKINGRKKYMEYSKNEIDYIRKNSDITSLFLYINEPTNVLDSIRRKNKKEFRFIGDYNYLIKCNWHDDKTASLTVSTNKELFNCHSCGVNGGIFDFLMKKYNISFSEAVLATATIFMIKLPESSNLDFVHDVRNVFMSDERLEMATLMNNRKPNIDINDHINIELRNRIINGVWDNSLYNNKVYRKK